MSILSTLIGILTRANAGDITDRFVEVYNAAVTTLSPLEQDVAKKALEERRLDNDEAHARLQALLNDAENR